VVHLREMFRKSICNYFFGNPFYYWHIYYFSNCNEFLTWRGTIIPKFPSVKGHLMENNYRLLLLFSPRNPVSATSICSGLTKLLFADQYKKLASTVVSYFHPSKYSFIHYYEMKVPFIEGWIVIIFMSKEIHRIRALTFPLLHIMYFSQTCNFCAYL